LLSATPSLSWASRSAICISRGRLGIGVDDDSAGPPADNGVRISMDGEGAWRDNVFVERLRRSVKYEEVYLRAFDSVAEARASIARYLDFYNRKRPH
jgi:transposase InsO family protein